MTSVQQQQQEAVLAFVRANVSRLPEDAEKCLELLCDASIYAGGVTEFNGKTVLLPDILHEGTARERFRQLKIKGFEKP